MTRSSTLIRIRVSLLGESGGLLWSLVFFFFLSFLLFFPLTLSLLHYHSFCLPGYHLCTHRESTKEEQGPENRTQVKRDKQELLAVIKRCSSLKSTRTKGVRGISCRNWKLKHKNVIEKGGEKRRNWFFPSASNFSRMHVSYLNCLVKETHLPQIWDKLLTAGQSSLSQHGPRR